MTAPGESQMAHCRDCAHRLGSGCGCECCPWAGDAVAEAAQAIGAYRDWAGTAGATDEALAREAVQAALPVVRAAAAAEVEERLQPELDRIEHDAIARYERFAAEHTKAVEMAVAAERERLAGLWGKPIHLSLSAGWSECGHGGEGEHPVLTDDPAKVTCRKCRRSSAYCRVADLLRGGGDG